MHRFVVLLLLIALPFPWVASVAQSPGTGATLLPGDAVRVQIWREEELSGEFIIDELGVVTLPLLGEVKITGLPLRQVRERLEESYRVHLLNPSISITPLRRINVLGAVQKPGLLVLDPTVSLAGAVALAGGATPDGDLRKVVILRGGEVILERVATAETLSSADIRSGDQIVVGRRSWFERNSTFLVSALLSITSVITSIIISNSNSEGTGSPEMNQLPMVNGPAFAWYPRT